jgi:hypothetical protein
MTFLKLLRKQILSFMRYMEFHLLVVSAQILFAVFLFYSPFDIWHYRYINSNLSEFSGKIPSGASNGDPRGGVENDVVPILQESE